MFEKDYFEKIRPFNDQEVKLFLENITIDKKMLSYILTKMKPNIPKIFHPFLYSRLRNKILPLTRGIETTKDMQQKLIYKLINDVVLNNCESFEIKNLTKLWKKEGKQKLLLVSNHRDITLDPALINYSLFNEGINTAYIAIGDNLLQNELLVGLIKSNKAFTVIRGLTRKIEIYQELKRLSDYINYLMSIENQNVWIANQEGRAKDCIDKVDPKILRMICLSFGKVTKYPIKDIFQEYKLIPVSISYEYDPCDIDKARELHQLLTTGSYQKSENEDGNSIVKGVIGYKGKVNINFSERIFPNSINDAVVKLNKAIISNYKLMPTNIVAYKYLCQIGKFKDQLFKINHLYSDLDLKNALNNLLDRCKNEKKEVKDIFLQNYANPVLTHLEYL